ncbi:hypothetical protein DIKCMJMK_01413 [Shewanella oneidensis]|uniref:hypothetical protein n=1 Tax=Shewanella oneidensis TaxID=70863 RepID=UPI0000167EAD|nr:hypothetical protein [Shewanella oneidensis]
MAHIDAAKWGASMAIAAVPLAPKALPPLKPNQPTQSMPAPVTVMVKLWGIIAEFKDLLRGGLSTLATTNAVKSSGYARHGNARKVIESKVG